MPVRAALICHHDEPLNRVALARWLASFTELAAVIVIQEPPGRFRKRVRREIQRVGLLRFLDVLAFRLYYRFQLAAHDRAWEQAQLESLMGRYPDLPSSCRVVDTPSPNSAEVLALLRELRPDIVIARCKTILKKEVSVRPITP